jgi:DNA invertase Pin-like site-specific DNA recombinase
MHLSSMAKPRKSSNEAGNGFVAYYRVSTARQGESGLGLDAQRAAVAKYVHGKNPLLAEFTEIESGKKNDRPQLAAALAASKRFKATLIIAKLDRLARNVAFISNLMECATEFVACDMPHANRLTIHILAAIAEHEREMISARTVAALEQVKARGVSLGNPHWRDSIAKARASRKSMHSSDRIQTLISSHRSQGKSLKQIADTLNEFGIRTPTGARWYASSVRSELQRMEFPKAA